MTKLFHQNRKENRGTLKTMNDILTIVQQDNNLARDLKK